MFSEANSALAMMMSFDCLVFLFSSQMVSLLKTTWLRKSNLGLRRYFTYVLLNIRRLPHSPNKEKTGKIQKPQKDGSCVDLLFRGTQGNEKLTRQTMD